MPDWFLIRLFLVRAGRCMRVVALGVGVVALLLPAQADDEEALLRRVARGDRAAIAQALEVGQTLVPALAAAVGSAPAEERRNLVLALGEIGGDEAAAVLRRLAQEDPDAGVRSAAVTGYVESNRVAWETVATLGDALGDPELSVALSALDQLLLMFGRPERGFASRYFARHPTLAPFLLPLLSEPDRETRLAAAEALLSAPLYEDRYLSLLEQERAPVDALALLAAKHPRESRALALALLDRRQLETHEREALVAVALRYGGDEARRYVSGRTRDGDPSVRIAALGAAAEMELPEALDAARQSLYRISVAEVRAGVEALRRVGGPKATAELLAAVRNEGWRRQQPGAVPVALAALMRLGGDEHLDVVTEIIEATPNVVRAELVVALPEALPRRLRDALYAAALWAPANDGLGWSPALSALLERRDADAIELVLGRLARAPSQLRVEHVQAVAKTGDRRFVPHLLRLLDTPDHGFRFAVLQALFELGDREGIERALPLAVAGLGSAPVAEQDVDVLRRILLESKSPEARLGAAHMLRPRVAEWQFTYRDYSARVADAFIEALSDPDVRVRVVAAQFLSDLVVWAIGIDSGLLQRIGAVCMSGTRDESDEVKALCLPALVSLGRSQAISRDEVVAIGLEHLWSVSELLQSAAISAAALSKDPAVWRELLLLSRSPRESARRSLESLVAWYYTIHGKEPNPVLLRLIEPGNPMRWLAARGQAYAPEAQQFCLRALEGDDIEEAAWAVRVLLYAPFPAEVREQSLPHARRFLRMATGEERDVFHQALLRLDADYAYEWARERLASPNPSVRRTALEATALSRHPDALELLLPIFSGWDFRLQEIAVGMLGGMAQPGATEALRTLLDHPEPAVRYAASQALRNRPAGW
ncbi:MAG: hypothetical protein AB1725_09010 [Armatimonadota bacterium]